MIGRPFVNVACDARRDGRQCLSATVMVLPAAVADRDQIARLFLAMNQDWAISGGNVFCPQCYRLAVAQAAERRKAAQS